LSATSEPHSSPDVSAAPTPPRATLTPLRSTTFRHLAAAYAINELGNWIGDVALAILVFDRTGSALATAALFLALRFAPAAVAPVFTSRLEVFAARRILPAIHLLEAAIFASIAWLSMHFSLPAVLALAIADGVLAITAKALTRSSTVALLRPHGALREGNAIINMGATAGGAVGPALAGALVGTLGPAPALLTDAVTFVVVAAILATATGLRLERHGGRGSLRRMRSGLGEAWSSPAVRHLLVAQALALVFFSAVIPIEVVFAKRTLHAGDSGYGALLAAWGLGMVAGGAAYAAAARVPLLLLLGLSTTLVAVGYGGLALAPNLAVACAFSTVGGVGNGAQWIGVVTAIQEGVSSASQSATMALLESINQVMPAIGFLLGGAVAALASPRAAYGTAAVGVMLVLLAAASRLPFDLERVEGRA